MCRSVALIIAPIIAIGGCGFRARGEHGDAATGEATATDTDGDGVTDAIDNCPAISNADQHDEDHDMIGDACDPCPQIDAPATDTDQDGIPDACDPHPMTKGDVLVKFDPFTGTGHVPPGWTFAAAGTPDDWTLADDTLTIAADNNTRILLFDTQAAHNAIQVGLDITAVTGGGSGFQFVTALADTQSNLDWFLGCGVRLDAAPPAPDRELFRFDRFAGMVFFGYQDVTDPPAPTGHYTFELVADTNSETCVIPGALDHKLIGTVLPRGNTYVGVRANDATVSFRWAAIYRF